MQKKSAIVVLLVLIIAAVGLYLHFKTDSNEPNGEENLFDNEGRYDSSNLDYMGVIYTNQSDILNWNGGYSESTACPSLQSSTYSPWQPKPSAKMRPKSSKS